MANRIVQLIDPADKTSKIFPITSTGGCLNEDGLSVDELYGKLMNPTEKTDAGDVTYITGMDSSGTPVKITPDNLMNAHLSDAVKTYINPASASATLVQMGNHDVIQDYVNKCKCYVFNAAGTKKAEIEEATFEGDYSGMTSGTVMFTDGTTKNISELNTAGCNFMVLRPEMGVGASSDGAMICAGTGSLTDGYQMPKKYIGMFKAYNQSSVLKSQPGRIPTGSQTIATFQSQAKAGGTGWGLWNYTDWCKENVLHLSYFGNTNYDVNIGTGRINNYSNVRNIVTGFTLPILNGHGTQATVDSAGNAVNCLNFFGLEGMGEQIWEFVIGFRHDGAGNAVIWNENEWSEDHTGRALTLPVTSASGSYIKTIIGGKYADMMPKAVGAGSTTGYCDGHWISSGGRLLFVGGLAGGGSFCSLSASSANRGFSDSSDNLGSRLAFYGECESVNGSELLA